MRILLACSLLLASAPAFALEDPVPPVDRSQVPLPGPAKVYTPPSVTTARLASGLRLALAEIPRYMIVTVKIVFPLAGAARDPEDKTGLAAIATAMLNEGTRRLPGLDFLEAVENAGASISISAGEDAAVLTVISNVETLGDALALAADMLRNPQFAFPVAAADAGKPHNPETRLASLKSRAVVGLAQAERSPKAQVERNIYQAVFGEHPYARFATAESVNAITLADIQAFRNGRMQPYAITAAGHIDMETLKRAAEKHFGSFSVADLTSPGALASEVPVLAANPVTTPKTPWKQNPGQWGIRLVDLQGSRRAEIMVGLRMVPRNHPDYVKLQVMRYVFGFGSAGRLNKRLREKEGWAYFGQGYIEKYQKGSILIAYSNVQPDKAGAAIIAIGEEISGMINGPEMPAAGDCEQDASSEICVKWQAWELELSQQQEFVAGYVLRGQGSYDGLAGAIAGSIINGLPEDSAIQYLNEVKAVTLPQVLEMAQRYLRREKLQVVVAGDAFSPVYDTRGNILPDAPTLYQQLSSVAPVRVLDIAGNDVAVPEPKDPA